MNHIQNSKATVIITDYPPACMLLTSNCGIPLQLREGLSPDSLPIKTIAKMPLGYC